MCCSTLTSSFLETLVANHDKNYFRSLFAVNEAFELLREAESVIGTISSNKNPPNEDSISERLDLGL